MPKLEFLDHVAIKVSDPEMSCKWYRETLGLVRFQPDAWKPVPIMVFAGNSGIALFQANDDVNSQFKESFHIAFRAAPGTLDDWAEKLKSLGIKFSIEDHVVFESIYFRDPDGYRLEITAPVE